MRVVVRPRVDGREVDNTSNTAPSRAPMATSRMVLIMRTHAQRYVGSL